MPGPGRRLGVPLEGERELAEARAAPARTLTSARSAVLTVSVHDELRRPASGVRVMVIPGDFDVSRTAWATVLSRAKPWQTVETGANGEATWHLKPGRCRWALVSNVPFEALTPAFELARKPGATPRRVSGLVVLKRGEATRHRVTVFRATGVRGTAYGTSGICEVRLFAKGGFGGSLQYELVESVLRTRTSSGAFEFVPATPGVKRVTVIWRSSESVGSTTKIVAVPRGEIVDVGTLQPLGGSDCVVRIRSELVKRDTVRCRITLRDEPSVQCDKSRTYTFWQVLPVNKSFTIRNVPKGRVVIAYLPRATDAGAATRSGQSSRQARPLKPWVRRSPWNGIEDVWIGPRAPGVFVCIRGAAPAMYAKSTAPWELSIRGPIGAPDDAVTQVSVSTKELALGKEVRLAPGDYEIIALPSMNLQATFETHWFAWQRVTVAAPACVAELTEFRACVKITGRMDGAWPAFPIATIAGWPVFGVVKGTIDRAKNRFEMRAVPPNCGLIIWAGRKGLQGQKVRTVGSRNAVWDLTR